MGALTLPSDGSVYLDTSTTVYSVERIEPYLTLLAPAFQAAEAGRLALVCSEIAIAEGHHCHSCYAPSSEMSHARGPS